MNKIMKSFGIFSYKDILKLEEESATLKAQLDGLLLYKKASLQSWSSRVRNGKACDCCGSLKKIEAHHLWSKSYYPMLALNLDNGVPLCAVCHRTFHIDFPNNEFISPRQYEVFKTIQRGKRADTLYLKHLKYAAHNTRKKDNK